MFTITGAYLREPVVLTWDDDTLTGDPLIVDAVTRLADTEVPVTPTGPTVVVDLADEWTVFCAARWLLGTYWASTPPECPDEPGFAVPEGDPA